MRAKRACILLLNWNGWADTVECLESVLAHTGDAPVVVVDNHSTDGSVERIEDFLRSHKVSLEVIDEDWKGEADGGARVTIIRNSANHGFAGGNNIGLRHILARRDVDFVWLLNSDTVIDPCSLPELVAKAAADDRAAFTGSVIRYYGDRGRVQCYGGAAVYRFLGITRLCMKNMAIENIKGAVKPRVDYLIGASMLVRLDAIREFGMMDESYFFFGEDIEWQYRARKNGWRIEVAEASYVYHKDSASTRDRKHVYFYYLNRGAITFIRRFYGVFTAIVASMSLLCITIIKNRSKPRNMMSGISGIIEGLVKGADSPAGPWRLW